MRPLTGSAKYALGHASTTAAGLPDAAHETAKTEYDGVSVWGRVLGCALLTPGFSGAARCVLFSFLRAFDPYFVRPPNPKFVAKPCTLPRVVWLFFHEHPFD